VEVLRKINPIRIVKKLTRLMQERGLVDLGVVLILGMVDAGCKGEVL